MATGKNQSLRRLSGKQCPLGTAYLVSLRAKRRWDIQELETEGSVGDRERTQREQGTEWYSPCTRNHGKGWAPLKVGLGRTINHSGIAYFEKLPQVLSL